MAKETSSVHEPLIRVVKRDPLPFLKASLVRAAMILAAVVVASVFIVMITGANPALVWSTMFRGVFKSKSVVWRFVRELAILLGVALALTPAFKMRFWNIGGEGQIVIGGLATYAVAMTLGGTLPTVVIVPLMLVAGLLAGAVWGLVPAIFKAFFGTNETLFTLMMNYVAIQLVAYFSVVWESPKGSGSIGVINPNTMIGWFPQIGSSKYLLNIIIVSVLTVAMYVYLNYSKQGYEISVVGESERTARYIGIKVEKVIMRTMLISGAICGLAGLLLVGGTNHTISTTTAGGRGFTAIMVSWLAKFDPLYMVLTSFLLIFLEMGAQQVSVDFRISTSISDIVTGIILLFIIGCEFFLQYRVVTSKHRKENV